MEEFVRTDQGYVEAKQKLFAFCWSSHLNFFLLQSGQQSFFEITGKLQKKKKKKQKKQELKKGQKNMLGYSFLLLLTLFSIHKISIYLFLFM